MNAHHYFFLALLGILTAALCFCTDLISVYLIDRKRPSQEKKPYNALSRIVKLQIVRSESIGYHTRYLIYVVFVIIFMLIAVSMS